MKKFLFSLICFTSIIHAADRPLGLTSLTIESPETELKSKGEVPPWLSGTLIRNGPALFNVGKEYVPHWFDGLAMLHSFRFADGKLFYKNKFLRTSAYETMVVNKSLNFSGFGQIGAKTETQFIPNANINVARFANSYVALTETPLPVIFDKQSLDTIGLFSYSDGLPQSKIWECAHPHYDAKTGDVINYQVRFFPEAKYVLYSMKKGSSTREVIAEIPVKEPAYMHSFALTEKYCVLVEFPLFVNPQDLLKEGSFSSKYKWKHAKDMRILVVSREKQALVGEYFAEPVFAWHHINSFEEDGTLYIDMAAYQDASTFTNTEDVTDDPEHKRTGRFVRYKVDLATKAVIKEALGPSIEMPRIDYERYNGKPYNYVYGYDDYNPLYNLKKRGLVKINTKTKFISMWSQDDCIADEPIFVAKPDGKHEDDGVLLAVVLDTKKKTSFLLILDALKFKELARFEVPHHIPYSLHGAYFP